MTQSIDASLVLSTVRVLIALVIATNAAFLMGCASGAAITAPCTPPGVDTTEHLHPLRGSLVTCLSDVNIKMVAADKRGLWWIDHDGTLILLPNDGTPVHVMTLDRGSWQSIAIDTDAVYVTMYERIKRTMLSAPTVSQVIASDWGQIDDEIVVDGRYVFWTEFRRENMRSSIKRWSKRSGQTEVIADNQVFPGHLAIDENNIYWSTSSVRKTENNDLSGRFMRRMRIRSRVEIPSRLMTVPKDGGTAKVLGKAKSKWSTDLPEADLIDDPWEEIAHIAVDSTHVYWTTKSPMLHDTTIWRTSKTDSTTTAMAYIDNVGSLALTHNHIYVDTPQGLLRIPKAGGAQAKSLAQECSAQLVSSQGIYCARSYLTATGDVLGRIELIREE